MILPAGRRARQGCQARWGAQWRSWCAVALGAWLQPCRPMLLWPLPTRLAPLSRRRPCALPALPAAADGPKQMSWAARLASQPPPPAAPAPATAASAPAPTLKAATAQPAPPAGAQQPQRAGAPPPTTGVTLPKGVAAVTERQPSIKFGNIDPSEIVPVSAALGRGCTVVAMQGGSQPAGRPHFLPLPAWVCTGRCALRASGAGGRGRPLPSSLHMPC